VNKFLAELDGLESSNENILIIGATNAIWDVDTAFKRPGRFDRVIFVPPPDEQSRAEIFKIALGRLPIADEVNPVWLAENTDKYSGADIQGLLNTAAEKVLEEIMENGKERLITSVDINAALGQTRPSTLEWLESAKNYVEFANATGQYDELKTYIEGTKTKNRFGF